MMRRVAALRNQGGFTLVELLVSLALLVVMLALINGALRFGRRGWEVSDDVERRQSVAAFRNLLGQRLNETLPLTRWDDRGVPEPTFQGASDQLSFLAPMPGRNAMPAGLFSISLKLLPTPGIAGWSLGLEFRPMAGVNAQPAASGHRPVLVENVATLAIRYYGWPEGAGEAKWFDEWQGQNRLPRLVTMDVQFRRGDPRAWAPFTAELKLGSRQQWER